MLWRSTRTRSRTTRGRFSTMRIRGCCQACWRRFSFWRITRRSCCPAARRRSGPFMLSREILALNKDKFYLFIWKSKGCCSKVRPDRLRSWISHSPLLLPSSLGLKRKHWKVAIIPLNMLGVRVRSSQLYITLRLSKKSHLRYQSWEGSTNNLTVWRKSTESYLLSILRSLRKQIQ